MRLSADSSDPGFDRYKSMRATVTLDEKIQRFAITADEELGLVHRYVLDENFDPVLGPENGELKTETVYGVVKITLKE